MRQATMNKPCPSQLWTLCSICYLLVCGFGSYTEHQCLGRISYIVGSCSTTLGQCQTRDKKNQISLGVEIKKQVFFLSFIEFKD